MTTRTFSMATKHPEWGRALAADEQPAPPVDETVKGGENE